MNDSEFNFILEDRIAKIRSINEQYDLENNSHISFSGGKDSTVLHYLLDLALPNNNIPRIFANTGIEYLLMQKYVKKLSQNDKRIIILKQKSNIRKTLREYGYPFKSKLHSQKVKRAQSNLSKGKEIAPFLKEYIGEKTYIDNNGVERKAAKPCPKVLIYQFKELLPFKVSDLCCDKLKKELIHNFEKESGKLIAITGMRKAEGGARKDLNCILTNKDGSLEKFHPLSVVDDEWENEFIKRYNIKLCPLYYPPYNLKRTGCKGCPFSLTIKEDLEMMEKLLPNERKQCELLWGKVYDEYRRIGYRLKENKFYNKNGLFDEN